METRKLFRMSLGRKREIGGYLFVMPFVVGFVLFFLYPCVQSVVFSLSRLELTQTGFSLSFVGVDNYRYAFLRHPTFVRELTATVLQTLKDVPLILVFSFFAAILLNQKFFGRGLARVIFFLPVILGAGVVLRMERSNYIMSMIAIDPAASETGLGGFLVTFLDGLRLPRFLIEYILFAIASVAKVISASGIQVMIFLAGLQSVPSSLYEAANVEGATGWESFCLITFPLMSPLVITNLVYTVVDSFTGESNTLLDLIRKTIFSGAGYGASAAMAWTYFAIVGVVLAITMAVVSKRVFYQK
ncbi:MAG: sugar ABC transporter permease [Firmicutes bacterium]|nr:sugar ABC transporter permease [Bacillota bacterium]